MTTSSSNSKSYNPNQKVFSTEGSWAQFPSMATERTWCTASYIPSDSKVYVMGGYNPQNKYLQSVEVLDLTTHTWSLHPKTMICHRQGAASVHVPSKKKIYVMGGFDGVRQLRSVEAYDLASGRWSLVSPMVEAREACAAVLLEDGTEMGGGKILVMGGYGRGAKGSLSSCEVYDVSSDTWSVLPEGMRERRSGLAAVRSSWNGMVYVFGGMDQCHRRLSSVEVFNPSNVTSKNSITSSSKNSTSSKNSITSSSKNSTSTSKNSTSSSSFSKNTNTLWRYASPMISRRYGMAAVNLKDGKIQIIGGNDDDRLDTNSIETYDVGNDDGCCKSCSSSTTLLHNRSAMAAVSIMRGEKIFLFGGRDGSNRFRSVEAFPDRFIALDDCHWDDENDDDETETKKEKRMGRDGTTYAVAPYVTATVVNVYGGGEEHIGPYITSVESVETTISKNRHGRYMF